MRILIKRAGRKPQSIKSLLQKEAAVFSVLALPFFSCTTLPLNSNTGENPLPQAGSVEEAVPFWQPLGDDAPGLDFFAGRIREPRLEFWVLRADLSNPGLGIVIGGGLSAHVTGFTEEYGCIAGINTTPFYPSSAREGEERTITGITVSGGVLISPPVSRYDALVFYKNGRAAIVSQGGLGDISQIENAAGGFYRVLEDGRLSPRLLEGDAPRRDLPRHSRSAAGLSADGKTLYLLVVDGMRVNSIGATEAELGLLLKQLGCYSGLNLDGGGSSALALRYPDGKARTVNTPIHNRIPGLQRGIAACLGIRVF